MTLNLESSERAYRAPNIDNVLRRRVRQLVAPFHERIGPWQSQLARLRVTRMFRAREDVRAHAAELSPLVVAARIELEAAVMDANDAAVAGHSLVASVRAALERLRCELEELSEAPEQ